MTRSTATRATFMGVLVAVAALSAVHAYAQVPNPPTQLSVVGGESLPPPPPPGQLSGLDWDGTATGLRMLYWHNVPNMYPMTVFSKVFMRSNAGISRPDGSRYGTIFFWGNDGSGQWNDGSENNSYWGIEPYPRNVGGTSIPNGPWRFEIAAWNNDYVTRDDGSAPDIVNNQWYSIAMTAEDNVNCSGVGPRSMHKGWLNLPSTTAANKIRTQPCYAESPSNWGAEPPQRAIFFGQSPPHPQFPTKSWGKYDGYDECNCVIRGIQIFTAVLTEPQIVTMSQCDTDQCVIDAAATQGLSNSLWYLNMNPKPTDVTDKSGKGHHGAWNGTGLRPTLWTSP